MGRDVQSNSRSTPFQETSRAENGRWWWRGRGWSHPEIGGCVTGWKGVEPVQVGGVTPIGGVSFRVVNEGT